MSTTLTLRIFTNEGVRNIPLEARPMRVGRAPESDVMIADPAISRHQLTISPHVSAQGVGALFTMNPHSPNQLVKDGRPLTEGILHSGEICFVGAYRFEIHATASLPQAAAGLLPEDPAGPIDVRLAEPIERIAPRWRQLNGRVGDAAAPSSAQALRGVLLPTAALLVCAALGWVLLGPDASRRAADASEMNEPRIPDLFAAMPKLECPDGEACLARAKDAVQLAAKLRNSGSRDLITAYKIAKQLHRANLALGTDADRIPDLPGKYEQARAELSTLFSDLYFRLQQARRNDNQREQLVVLKTLRPLCDEDRHAFCTKLELQYRLLKD